MNVRLQAQSIAAEHGNIIEMYEISIENIDKRFLITNDHVIATLLDPTCKKLSIIDQHVHPSTKQSLLKIAIKDYNIKMDSSDKVISIILFQDF